MHPHATASNCAGFCCSDFKNFVDEPTVHQNDPLQNPVLEFFTSDRFNVSKAWYKAVLFDACRLASRLVWTDAFVRHVVTVMDGDMYGDSGKSFRRGRRLTSISEVKSEEGNPRGILLYAQKAVTHEMRNRARLIMLDMIRNIDFVIAMPDEKRLPEGAAAVCRQLPDRRAVFRNMSDRQRFKHGIRSQIVLGWRVWWPVVQTLIKSDAPAEPAMPYHRWQLARTILHEFGHALSNARFGPDTHEPFHHSSWCCEGGFDLENALFGGIIQEAPLEEPPIAHYQGTGPSQHEYCIMMDWPSRLIARDCIDGDAYLGLRGEPAFLFDRIHRVPNRFFNEILTESFWKKREKAGAEVLAGPIRPTSMPTWIAEAVPCGIDESNPPGDQIFGLHTPHDESKDGRKTRWRLADINSPSLNDWVRNDLHAINSKRQWRGRKDFDDCFSLEESFLSL
ncbi:hypothetical protein Slin14017_G122900 [Septoria linicola]|nr:hypothetical protein Slin14017_G122900 [Septoria linicola]